jgi:hypothetical protein
MTPRYGSQEGARAGGTHHIRAHGTPLKSVSGTGSCFALAFPTGGNRHASAGNGGRSSGVRGCCSGSRGCSPCREAGCRARAPISVRLELVALVGWLVLPCRSVLLPAEWGSRSGRVEVHGPPGAALGSRLVCSQEKARPERRACYRAAPPPERVPVGLEEVLPASAGGCGPAALPWGELLGGQAGLSRRPGREVRRKPTVHSRVEGRPRDARIGRPSHVPASSTRGNGNALVGSCYRGWRGRGPTYRVAEKSLSLLLTVPPAVEICFDLGVAGG